MKKISGFHGFYGNGWQTLPPAVSLPTDCGDKRCNFGRIFAGSRLKKEPRDGRHAEERGEDVDASHVGESSSFLDRRGRAATDVDVAGVVAPQAGPGRKGIGIQRRRAQQHVLPG